MNDRTGLDRDQMLLLPDGWRILWQRRLGSSLLSATLRRVVDKREEIFWAVTGGSSYVVRATPGCYGNCQVRGSGQFIFS
jgi:hypothetical protein